MLYILEYYGPKIYYEHGTLSPWEKLCEKYFEMQLLRLLFEDG